jgi:hypothetical protein
MTKSITDLAREAKLNDFGVAWQMDALERFATLHRAAILQELTGEMPEPVLQRIKECKEKTLNDWIWKWEGLFTADQMREYAAGLVAKRDAALDECVKALTVDASWKRVYPESRMKALAMIEAIRNRGNV